VIVVLVLFGGRHTPAAVGKYDLTVFGEVSYRSTNFFRTAYDYNGGWTEVRAAARNVLTPGLVVGFSPYLKTVAALANHVDLPEENMIVYGAGIELRFLSARNASGANCWLSWLTQIRVYIEYLRASFLRRDVGPWVPRRDWRLGAEIWREINVELAARTVRTPSLGNHLWAEVWADFSWKKSNFFLESFDSWTSESLLRLGARYPRIIASEDVFLMPYVAAGHSFSQWCFPWQNRALAGVGMRIMPFPHAQSRWLRRLRFSGERLWIVRYFDDRPIPGTPDRDWRIGVSFSNTWR
jgi:hypothetical protein